MNYLDAQVKFADTLHGASERVQFFFWRLSGEEPNSLSVFCSMPEAELVAILRLCKVYIGKNNNLSKNNFELLMERCGFDYTTHQVNGVKDKYILIGAGGEKVLPKDLYDAKGQLVVYPVPDKHVLPMKTKLQKGNIPILLDAAKAIDSPDPQKKAPKKQQKNVDVSPRSLLFKFVEELVGEAAASGKSNISVRSQRKLGRLFQASTECEAKDMLERAMEKLSAYPSKELAVTTPDRAISLPNSSVEGNINLVTPTVLLPSEDVEAVLEEEAKEQSAADEFLQDLQEEALLQSLLHKRIQKERVFELEHKNGRRLLVACPPDSQTSQSFQEEASKSGWVDKMLNTAERKEGMLSYMAKSAPETYQRIAKKRKLSTGAVDLTTAETVALARVGNLNDIRLKKARSFLRHIGKVNLQYSAKDLKRLDDEVGLNNTEDCLEFGECLHEWSKTKGKEKKAPELVQFWNSSLMKEIESEVDLYLRKRLAETKETSPQPMDYKADGFETKGITVLIGGDHGDKNCPISAKLNLSSPQERKERKELNYMCPMVQFASVKCTKDTYELLQSTVMPKVKQETIRLRESAIVTVYHSKAATKKFKSFAIRKTINMNTVAFRHNPLTKATEMTYAFGVDPQQLTFGSVQLGSDLSAVPYFEPRACLVIGNFNELYIGDLAFLAMLIGMNNSSGNHCLLCMLKGSEFNNCPHGNPRTKETLAECLEQYLLLVQQAKDRNKKKQPANYKGVNCEGLVDIDPQRIVVPILHCPMGLVDKVLESFKQWVNYDVEELDETASELRRAYQQAKADHTAAIETHRVAANLAASNPTNAQAKQVEAVSDRARIDAKKVESKAKEKLDDALKTHNAKRSSCCQTFESIYRGNGISREHYHGGKFNGVNSCRVMEKAKKLFVGDAEGKGGFMEACISKKQSTVSVQMIRNKCHSYARLLGLLDGVWSNVRGIDSGLLPTEDQSATLERTLAECKQNWLDLGLTTLQPKWHLTFEGHLLQQTKDLGGLADKADDSIEKFHQELKPLRDRFRGSQTYKQRETCVRRELRRKKSASVKHIVDRYEGLIKQSTGTKRHQDTLVRVEERKRAKVEKREAFIAPIDNNNHS